MHGDRHAQRKDAGGFTGDAIAPCKTVKITRTGNKPFEPKKAADTSTNRYQPARSKFRLEPIRTAKLWEKLLVTINLHA